MSFRLIGGSSDLSGVVNDMNQNILEMKNREITEIFKDEAGTRRVLLGKGADDFYGLKVSKTGYDVYTANGTQLIFNSDTSLLKIAEEGTVTSPAIAAPSAGSSNSSTAEVTTSVISSDGTIPPVLFFLSGHRPLPYQTLITNTASPYGYTIGHTIYGNATLSGSNEVIVSILAFNAHPGNALAAFDITYYVLQETIT